MRSEEEVPVNHLVVDTSGFIKNVPLINIGAKIYTVRDVVNEIRDKDTRERLRCLPYELHLRDPTTESITIVKEISKRTGDFPALSLTDLKLLALTHDIHVEYLGKESINYDVKNAIDITSKGREVDVKMPNSMETENEESGFIPYGFVEPTTENGDDLVDDEGWIDESNLKNVLTENEVFEEIRQQLGVALMSSDFAIQNTAKHMKLNLVGINGQMIKELRSHVMRCRACYNITADMTKKFCPKCGNDTLNQVAVSVNEDGSIKLHIDYEKLKNTRGLRKQQKTIKGGKHDDCDQFFEDQRIPHNRPAKSRKGPISDGPFAVHDLSSRSAMLGIRKNRRRR